MNVLIVTNTWLSSSEVFIKNLVDGLLERDVSVTVLCKKPEGSPGGKSSGQRKTIRFFTARTTLLTTLRLLLVFPFFVVSRPTAFISLLTYLVIHHDFSTLLAPLAWFQVRKTQFDAIHCQFGYLGNIGIVLKKSGLTKGPVVSSFRGSDISSYLGRKPAVYRVLKNKGDLFLPVSGSFRDRLIQLGFPESKIRIYHSAINLKDFPFRVPVSPIQDSTTILCAGRLVEKKGFSYAIDALAVLVQRNPAYRLVIAGDGPLADTLRRQANHAGIPGHVQFTGWVDQTSLGTMLSQSSVFLATNIESRSGDTDGIPNIVKEAMAVGVPVVAFDHPGLTELITNGISGILVPSHDLTALVAALESLDDEMVKRVCVSARREIEQNYSKESQAAYLEQLIREYSE